MPLDQQRRSQLNLILDRMAADGRSDAEMREAVAEFKAKYEPVQKDAVGEALGQIGGGFHNALAGIGYAATHPLEILPSMAAAQAEQAGKAKEEFSAGNYGRAARRTLAAVTPILGPMIENTAEVATTEPWRAATEAGLAALPFGPRGARAAGVRPPKLPTPSLIRNANNAVEEGALAAAEAHLPGGGGVPMSFGQRTGNRGVRRVEQGLEAMPFAGAPLQRLASRTEAALQNWGRNLPEVVSPTRTNDFGAGEGMSRGLQGSIDALRAKADAAYDAARQAAAANQKTVQTGTKASPILDPSGRSLQTPVFQTLESPVDINAVRSQLAPVYADLSRLMPEAQRSASPAYAALRNLMENPDAAMNAMDFDQFLGAMKALSREGKSPFLTTRSQAIARQMIGAGEAELSKALPANVQKELQTGRTNVAKYYEVAELLEGLPKEPAQLYTQLVKGGDKSLNALRMARHYAPAELQAVGRTFLEDILTKSTGEGGFIRGAGALEKWNALGPETKALLYGKDLSEELGRFFLAAKRLTSHTNPSGTAMSLLAAGPLAALLSGNPAASASALSTLGAGRVLANLLANPGGASRANAALLNAFKATAVPISAGATIDLSTPQNPNDQFRNRFSTWGGLQ